MNSLGFFQFFEHESSTYTYLLFDEKTRDAVIIDSVRETWERDHQWILDLNLNLMFILETHIHADHITGAAFLKKLTGAKTALSAGAQVKCVDRSLNDGDQIEFGSFKLRALATPGHTDSCMSFYLPGFVFTGDTLLIRGCGRTDFQQGSSETLYESVTKKLFTLPPETRVYPAHDYKGHTASSIKLEKELNPRLGAGKSKDDFTKIMSELKLALPKKIKESVPANLSCGERVEL